MRENIKIAVALCAIAYYAARALVGELPFKGADTAMTRIREHSQWIDYAWWWLP